MACIHVIAEGWKNITLATDERTWQITSISGMSVIDDRRSAEAIIDLVFSWTYWLRNTHTHKNAYQFYNEVAIYSKERMLYLVFRANQGVTPSEWTFPPIVSHSCALLIDIWFIDNQIGCMSCFGTGRFDLTCFVTPHCVFFVWITSIFSYILT